MVVTRLFNTFVGSDPEQMWSSSSSIFKSFNEFWEVIASHPGIHSYSLFYGLFYLRNEDIQT